MMIMITVAAMVSHKTFSYDDDDDSNGGNNDDDADNCCGNGIA